MEVVGNAGAKKNGEIRCHALFKNIECFLYFLVEDWSAWASKEVIVVFNVMTTGSTSGVYIASLLTSPCSLVKEPHIVLLCPGFVLFAMFSVYPCENFPINRRSTASEKTIPSQPNTTIGRVGMPLLVWLSWRKVFPYRLKCRNAYILFSTILVEGFTYLLFKYFSRPTGSWKDRSYYYKENIPHIILLSLSAILQRKMMNLLLFFVIEYWIKGATDHS